MGCDIHTYIEFYSKKDLSLAKGNAYAVNTFARNMGFNRDYVLFGAIAGIRCLINPVVFPKGVPTAPGLSYEAQSDYYLFVSPNIKPEEEYKRDFLGRRVISQTKADELIKKYSFQYADAEKTLIPDPDYHTATWLTLSEMMQVRKLYLLEYVQYYAEIRSKKKIKQIVDFIENTSAEKLMNFSFTEYDSLVLNATIASMSAIEKTYKNNDVVSRFVCWFDS